MWNIIQETMNSITNVSYNRAESGDIILGIFFISLIFIAIYEKEKNIKILLLYFSLLFTAIYFFPPIAIFLLSTAVDEASFYRMFWLLPIVIAIPHVLVRLESLIKLRIHKVFFVFMVTLFFVLRIESSHSLFEISENLYKMPSCLIEIIHTINEDSDVNGFEEKRALFPIDLIPYVRQYDASFILPVADTRYRIEYMISNRNENIRELYEMIEDDCDNISRFITLLEKERINIIILPTETELTLQLKDELKEIGSSSYFTILIAVII